LVLRDQEDPLLVVAPGVHAGAGRCLGANKQAARGFASASREVDFEARSLEAVVLDVGRVFVDNPLDFEGAQRTRDARGVGLRRGLAIGATIVQAPDVFFRVVTSPDSAFTFRSSIWSASTEAKTFSNFDPESCGCFQVTK
jgi:hypothetical protein